MALWPTSCSLRRRSSFTNPLRAARLFLELVKFPHTVFALPFALLSAVVAADRLPTVRTLLWILVAMAGARSAAMAFNRLVDASHDAQNPRTADRALPKGIVSRRDVALFIVSAAALFVFAASRLNHLAFALSPVALAIILGYSYVKRFTPWTHLVLGLALGVAPVGAWIAVRGAFGLFPIALGLAVVLWVAGFDIIYACQDAEFDRTHGLFSFPQTYGVEKALRLSAAFHLGAVVVLLALVASPSLGFVYLAGVIIASLMLWYEHAIVKPTDLSNVNAAFFTVNGIISIVIMSFAIADVLLGGR